MNVELQPSDVSSDELERCFIYAMIWSLGGFLTSQNKIFFDHWWRKSFNCMNEQLSFPDKGLIWDYFVKPGCTSFTSWCSDSLHLSPHMDYMYPVFVPTKQSKSVIQLFSLLIDEDCPVLLSGDGGSGKTSLLLNYLNGHCKPDVSDTAFLHLYVNHSTSAETVWNQIQHRLEWRWGRRYTPKGSKKLLCFIDDLHNTEVNVLCSFASVSHPKSL